MQLLPMTTQSINKQSNIQTNKIIIKKYSIIFHLSLIIASECRKIYTLKPKEKKKKFVLSFSI